MKIDLEGLDIDTLVKAAFSDTLKATLARQLPKIVDSSMNQQHGMGRMSLLQRALQAAIEVAIQENINEFLANRQDDIRHQVRLALEQQLQPGIIAERVADALKEIKITLHPLYTKPKRTTSDDMEEDD